LKALICLGCKAHIIVPDSANAGCSKCGIEMQENMYLNIQFKLEKDPLVKRRYIKKDPKKIKKGKKIKKIKKGKKIKKTKKTKKNKVKKTKKRKNKKWLKKYLI